MKKTLLLFVIVAMLTISHTAANPRNENYFGKRPEKQRTIKKENAPVIRNLSYYTEHQKKNDVLKTKLPENEKKEKDLFSITMQDFSGLSDFSKAKSMKGEITKYQMDSVIFIDQYGGNIWKIELLYDENFWPIRQKNMLWEAFSMSYEIAEDWNYEWNEDGYLTAEWTVIKDFLWGDWGWKDVYHYNEDNLCTEWVKLDYYGGDWVYTDSITFQYDERGNPIELVAYAYDGDSWYKSAEEYAEYDDPYDRQTYYEGYYLDWNGEWVGEGKDIIEWLDNPVERMTHTHNSIWNSTTNDWENWRIITQEWNEDLKCTLQEFLFWDPVDEDWTGMFSGHSIMTFLEDGRPDNECWWNLTGGTFVKGYELDCEWEIYAGEDQVTKKGYRYNADGTSKTQEYEMIARYCDFYQPSYAYENELYTYFIESLDYGGGWEYDNEINRIFDDKGRITFDAQYFFIDENWAYSGVKTAFIAGRFAYDNDDNTIEQLWEYGTLMNYGYGEPEDWVNFSKFDYEYDDFRNMLRKYRYTYPDGTTPTPDWGDGVDYNHEIPGSLLITFPEHYDDPFMMTYLYEYEGNGVDFDELVKTFYYSEKIVESNEEYTITVSANPATCSAIGGGTFEFGTEITIEATPCEDCVFVNWTENGIPVSTDSIYTFAVLQDRDLVANFYCKDAIGDIDADKVQVYYAQDVIYFKNILPNTLVQVVDVMGRIIIENTISENSMPFTQKGIYIVRLTNNNVMQMQKIVAY